ncbi:MAG: pyruvate dehydrogenase complex dihydrolipoamide acetyltransferase, partial [Gammaproteobacteria bacterium]
MARPAASAPGVISGSRAARRSSGTAALDGAHGRFQHGDLPALEAALGAMPALPAAEAPEAAP